MREMRVFLEHDSHYGRGRLFATANKAFTAITRDIEDDIRQYNIVGDAEKTHYLEKELEAFKEAYENYIEGDADFGTEDYWVEEVEVH